MREHAAGRVQYSCAPDLRRLRVPQSVWCPRRNGKLLGRRVRFVLVGLAVGFLAGFLDCPAVALDGVPFPGPLLRLGLLSVRLAGWNAGLATQAQAGAMLVHAVGWREQIG